MPVDPDRVRVVLVAAAAVTDPDQRSAVLDRECGADTALRRRVEELLRTPGGPANPPDPERTAAYEPGRAQPELAPNSLFGGRYKVREKLGEGGMAIVYVADQTEPVVRRVALKVIKADVPTDRMLARFEQERQALAIMDHPNIARVFDGGIADAAGGGRFPFFVMELIKGVPITRYCDEARLSPRERLQLFLPVCQAVQHAHQKGVIHRDLKPSNILVGLFDGRPVPKIIDFGVAKATGTKLSERSVYTEVGAIIGTIEYMSPEQAELDNLDVDTRTDVYSLGVILYELLTGAVPLSRRDLRVAGLAEMLRIIKEVEPRKPSTKVSSSEGLPNIAAVRHTEPRALARMFRGDLDWIVMKALEKDRTRRYETANGFALDVQRYLADEPVLAGPPTARYRLGKFVRRNRVHVTAATVVLLSLVGGIVGTALGWVHAIEARRVAETARSSEEGHRTEAERQRDLADERLTELETERKRALEQKAAAEANERTARQEKQVSDSVRDFFCYRLLGQADSRTQADSLRDQGGFSSAIDPHITVRQLLDRAAAELSPEKIETAFPNQPEVQADLLLTCGQTFRGVGEMASAVVFLQRAAALRERHSPDGPETLIALYHLGSAYEEAGKLPDAIRLLTRVRDGQVRQLGAGHDHTRTTLNALGLANWRAGKYSEAIAAFEELRDATDGTLAPDDPGRLMYLHNLALAYHDGGRLPEAIRLYEQVRDGQVKKLGPDDPDTLRTMTNLAEVYREVGRLPEATRLYEQAREGQAKKLGPDHPDTLVTLNNLALVYWQTRRLADARKLFEQVRDAQTKKLGGDHPDTLTTASNLAGVIRDAGNLPEAIKLFEQVREAKLKKIGPDHPSTWATVANLAAAYRTAGRLEEAVRLSEEAHASYLKAFGPDHQSTLGSASLLATAYYVFGRVSDAIRLFEESRERFEKSFGPDHVRTRTLLQNLALAYWRSNQFDKANTILKELLTRQETKVGRSDPESLRTIARLGMSNRDSGKLGDAVPLLEEAYREGKRDPSLAWIGHELALAYIRGGKLAMAGLQINDHLQTARAHYKADSPQLADVLAGCGQNLIELRHFDRADTILRECLALRQKLVERNAIPGWQVANAKSLLGGSQLGQRRYAEAEGLLLDGYTGLKLDVGAIPIDGKHCVADTVKSLIELYSSMKKPGEVDAWKAKLAKEGPSQGSR
jgi:eukaryotic-like serine/threonine-protein kinase